MQITWSSNEGGGGNRDIEVPTGATVLDVVRQYQPSFSPERHQVRVNRSNAGLGDILEEGDLLALMPAKVGGGR